MESESNNWTIADSPISRASASAAADPLAAAAGQMEEDSPGG